MNNEIQRKEEFSLLDIAKRIPLDFPIRELRRSGRTERLTATRVEIEGDEIYAVIPGSSRLPYRAARAVVSWETPMDISVLAVEENGVSVRDTKQLQLGKLEFRGYRRDEIIKATDPDLVLYDGAGREIVRINQAQGIPTLYVKGCKVTYHS